MKIITILAICLTLSLLTLNICKSYSRNHRYRKFKRVSISKSTSEQSNNKWFQFIVGLILGLSGQDNMDLSLLNQCLPDNWKVTDTSPVPEAIPQEQPPKSTFTSILDAIEKVINFICAFKNKIMGLLGMKMRRYVRRLRYRMLAETRVTRFQKNIFKKIKSRFQKVGAKIKTAAHKVGGKIKEVGNKIKHKFHEIGDKIKKMAL